MKRLVWFSSALVLVAVGLSIHLVTAGGTSARSGRAAVRVSRAAPTGAIVRARRLLGLTTGPATLDLPASAPLVGNLGPAAVPSRDGRYVAYNTWRWAKQIDWQQSLGSQGIRTGDPLGWPALRVRDLQTGADVALGAGSLSAAWRADGELAYAQGTTPDYLANTPYLRDVVVRRTPAAAPVVWSSAPDRYLVEGWAGNRLVVRRELPDGGADLVVFDGPRSMRPLASGAELLAIDPNGSDVLVAENLGTTPAPAVRLIAVADGHEEGRLPLAGIIDPTTKAAITSVAGPGDWRRDRAVISSSSGLVVLHVTGGALSIEQVMHVDSASKPGGVFYEPRFTDDSEHTIVAWADLPASSGRQSAQFVCDRFALSCTESAPVASQAAPRPVYDESGGDQ